MRRHQAFALAPVIEGRQYVVGHLKYICQALAAGVDVNQASRGGYGRADTACPHFDPTFIDLYGIL
jgi:hypothetical protein